MHVGEGRPFRPLDGLVGQFGRARGHCIGREEMSEREAPPQREVRMPRDVMPASDADRDRPIDRAQAEEDPTDDARGLAVPPFPLCAALLDVERRGCEIGTVVGRLEGHLVTEMSACQGKGPERRGHPPWGRWDEGLGLPPELRVARIPDRVDGQTRPPAFRAMFRQIHDEIRGVLEARLEIPVQVVAVQVRFRDREEDEVPQPPSGSAAKRVLVLPRLEAQQLVPLGKARFVRLRRDEEAHPRSGAQRAPWSLPCPPHKLYVGGSGTPTKRWSRSPFFLRFRTFRKAASRRWRIASGRSIRNGKSTWSRRRAARRCSPSTSSSSARRSSSTTESSSWASPATGCLSRGLPWSRPAESRPERRNLPRRLPGRGPSPQPRPPGRPRRLPRLRDEGTRPADATVLIVTSVALDFQRKIRPRSKTI